MSKYNNKFTTVDGIKFHSKGEALYYLELKGLQKAGKIKNLKLQTKFPYKGKSGKVLFNYISDYDYTTVKDNKYHVVDYKGVITAIFRLKKKLIEDIYPFQIEIVK